MFTGHVVAVEVCLLLYQIDTSGEIAQFILSYSYLSINWSFKLIFIYLLSFNSAAVFCY